MATAPANQPANARAQQSAVDPSSFPTTLPSHHPASVSPSSAGRPPPPAATSATSDWQPVTNRRPSWDRQERKHELQMTSTGAAAVQGGHPGFSEGGGGRGV